MGLGHGILCMVREKGNCKGRRKGYIPHLGLVDLEVKRGRVDDKNAIQAPRCRGGSALLGVCLLGLGVGRLRRGVLLS